MPLPPGPPALPLIGDLRMLSEDSGQYVFELYRRYGDMVRVQFGPSPLVFLRGPRFNRLILSEQADDFLNRPPLELLEGPMFGDGVLVQDGDEHRRSRRMLQPAFHRQRIRSALDGIAAETHRVVDEWAGEIDIASQMQRLTLNIVARVLFSMDLSAETQAFSRAWDQVMTYNGHPWGALLARVPFSVRRVGLRRIDALIARMIAARRAAPGDQGDALSMLLAARDEDGAAFSDRQIRDHLLILFLAGHETSSNGLAWMFYLLAQHPAWARRVLDELDAVLGGRDPALDDLDRLPVLDMVIKEAMRILPPVVGFTRAAARDLKIEGCDIPAGTLVLYTIIGTHYLPDLYPDPLVFRPERFAPDAPRRYSAYEYLPFGAGGRLCLGQPLALMEIKVVLATALQKFRLDLVPGQTVKAVFRGSLYPRHGLRMRVQPQDGAVERSAARVYGNVPGAEGRQLGDVG